MESILFRKFKDNHNNYPINFFSLAPAPPPPPLQFGYDATVMCVFCKLLNSYQKREHKKSQWFMN